MTKDEVEFWLEVGKVVASIATPIVVVTLGILLLRRIESIKATVVKQSEFHKKWAEQFFECGQQFMQALERDLTQLTVFAGLNTNDALGVALQEEISQLNTNLLELELRIRRSVVFAPTTGGAVTKASSECMALLHNLLASKKGSLDEIIGKMNEFNLASRMAHAEMLGLNDAERCSNHS